MVDGRKVGRFDPAIENRGGRAGLIAACLLVSHCQLAGCIFASLPLRRAIMGPRTRSMRASSSKVTLDDVINGDSNSSDGGRPPEAENDPGAGVRAVEVAYVIPLMLWHCTNNIISTMPFYSYIYSRLNGASVRRTYPNP